MNLAVHIKNLLYDHDCIILPGFGAFLATYKSAEIHPVTHQFSPPSKSISFNSRLTQDDGVLNDHIARYEKLGFNEAREIATDFITNLKRELRSYGKVKLEGVGTFALNAESNLVFIAEPGQNYLPDSYGLPIFIQKPVIRNKPVLNVQGSTPLSVTAKKPTKWLLASVAAVLLLVVLLNLIAFNAYSPHLAIQQGNIMSIFSLFSQDEEIELSVDDVYFQASLPELPLLAELEPAKDTLINVMELTNQESKVTAFSDEEKKLGYYVIMGSFKQLENAEKLLQDLRDERDFIQILPLKNGYHRVGVFSGTDKAESIELLYAKRTNQKDAWLLNYHSLGQ